MPQDTRFTIIRRNRFVKEKGGSTEVNARPNVLVGHFPLEGPGSDDTHAIYGNLFLENPNEALFQDEGNIALYSNVFFNSHDIEFLAIAIQPHNDVPKRIDIFGNRVFHPKVGIRFIAPPERQAVELRTVGNDVYAAAPFLGANSQGNTTFRTEASLESYCDVFGDGARRPGELTDSGGRKLDFSPFEHLPDYNDISFQFFGRRCEGFRH